MENNRSSTSSATNMNLMKTKEKLHKGYAVIFNNETFDVSLHQEEREGTANDVIELKNIFKHFNIDVHVKQNFTLNQIQEEVKTLSTFNFSPYECFIIVILSHGKENNMLYAHDWYYNLNETIVYPIVNANPSLAGKPKIFIIQACKGSMNLINLLKADACASIPLPTISDMYFAFSTFEGFVSNRHTTKGGIFIQKFCEMLMKDGPTLSISTIMELVTLELLEITEKQVPMVVTTMSKPFIFGNIGKGMTKKIMINNGNGCFKKLPRKLILEIFSYLSLNDLKDASRVCKKWNNAFKHPKTQDKLKLVLNEQHFNEFLTNYKERTFHNVDFHKINFTLNTECMKFLGNLMPNIKFLSFNCCEIKGNQLLLILKMTRNLKILKISDCKLGHTIRTNNYNLDSLENIKHFEFSKLDENHFNGFHELLKGMTNLEILLVHKHSSYLIPNNLLQTSVYLPRIGKGQVDSTAKDLDNYLYKCIEKRALSLKFIEAEGFILKLLENIVKINYLKLEKLIIREEIEPVLLKRIVEYQPSIIHLEIKTIIRNIDLITICKKLPKLKFLKIGNCKEINDNGIKDLWKLKQLKSLFLLFCEKSTTGGFTNGLKEKNDNLHSLKLWGLNSCENLLMHIVNKFIQLRELELRCESGITEKEIQKVWRNLRSLKKLVIDCNGMTVTDFAYTGKNIQNESEINGCSIANIKGLTHLELFFINKITISSIHEIAKLKELVLLYADFSCSKIKIKDVNILSSCKLLETIDIQLSQEFIPEIIIHSLKKKFRRIKSFHIDS